MPLKLLGKNQKSPMHCFFTKLEKLYFEPTLGHICPKTFKINVFLQKKIYAGVTSCKNRKNSYINFWQNLKDLFLSLFWVIFGPKTSI